MKLPYRVDGKAAALIIYYKDSWKDLRFYLTNYADGSNVELTKTMGVKLLDKLSYVNAVVSSIDGLPERAFAIVNDETTYSYENDELDSVVERVLDSGYAQSGIKSHSQSIHSLCEMSGRIGHPLTDLLCMIRKGEYTLVRKETET